MRLVTTAVRSQSPHLIDAAPYPANGMVDGKRTRDLAADSATLTCPHCGGEQLHQLAVEVYFRKEDASHGINASVFGTAEMCHTSHSQARNPSPRRDGVRIRFSCEHCPKESSLAIVQHKGDTNVFWEMA